MTHTPGISAGLPRRTLIGALAAAPAVAAAQTSPDADPVRVKIDVLDAYAKLFASRRGGASVWWLSGVMFAHVDGLREFSIVQERALLVCRVEAVTSDRVALSWRQIGYYQDLMTGEPAAGWDNPFTGQRRQPPRAFASGPAHAVAGRTGPVSASLKLAASDARVIAASLTGSGQEGRVTLTQTETAIRGFPGPDGRAPAPDASGATGVQTVMALIAAQDEVQDPARDAVAASGYYSLVWDSLPAWLGFGARYGSALTKGEMVKAAPDARLNPQTWRRLKALHPDAFAGDALRTDWA